MKRSALIGVAFFLMGAASGMSVPTAQGNADSVMWCLPYQNDGWSQPGVWIGTGDIPDEAIRAYEQWIASQK